jgi:hypothetical protein
MKAFILQFLIRFLSEFVQDGKKFRPVCTVSVLIKISYLIIFLDIAVQIT